MALNSRFQDATSQVLMNSVEVKIQNIYKVRCLLSGTKVFEPYSERTGITFKNRNFIADGVIE